MTLYQIKPAFQRLLRPLMFWLHKHSITPNHITFSAIALSFITGGILAFFHEPRGFVLLPIVLFVRMALNALDGMLARECNQKTVLGAILNETGDVLSDIALYIPFMLLPDSNTILVLCMLLCALMTEFSGILAQTFTGIRSYTGPLGKSDRALVFGAWGLALAYWPSLVQWNNALWGVATLLLLWTVTNRCRSALRHGETI